jgi:DNA-binding winged helix-turn-helix (wHTH) protein/predicted ATPase/type II secretory pathway predicted ATPase ExeA
MSSRQQVDFAHFRVDLANEQLWRENTPIPLRRQTFAVLRYLVEHAGQVVSKAALLDALWPGVYVTDMAPMICIRELRKALGDDARVPQFIETVHRRGYRWLAALRWASLVPSFKFQVSNSYPASTPQHLTPILVGREIELAQLHHWLDKALRGERQIIFVTGEPGIGKTTVVEAFLQSLASEQVQGPRSKVQGPYFEPIPNPQPPIPNLWIGRGQCVEHYGVSEPYLPVLETLGRLGRGPDGEHLIAVLRQYAPTWLVHLPALLSPAEREQLQQQTQGTTPQRMLRELSEALEVLTADRGLILALEDLHWSDMSTLTWLSFLARRRESARVLVIGTYRPVEVLGNGHPLRVISQELLTHRQGVELRLGMLSEAAVGEYVTQRLAGEVFDDHVALPQLAHAIHQRTEGNPLFIVNIVDALVDRKRRKEQENEPLYPQPDDVRAVIPADLKQMIERQIEQLPHQEQQILEVASVVGVEFTAAAVAAGLQVEVRVVEDCCERLARREFFVQAHGSRAWPDGTVSAHYRFLHALYQEVLYSRVTPGRGVELHRSIAEREEQAYGQHTREIAAELAVRFERGRDICKAVQYLRLAGENATRRSAHREAISLLTKGVGLLRTLPDAPERTRQELSLQIALGRSLAITRGYSASEVEQVYARALELCKQIGETPQLFRVLRGLWSFYETRAEHQTARGLAEQCLVLARRAQEPLLLLGAHLALGQTLYFLGELAQAREHWEQGIALYNPQQHSSHAFQSPVVLCLQFVAEVLWHLGYPEQALKRIQDALTLAQEMNDPFSLAFTLGSAAQIHQYRREVSAAREQTDAAITLASELGFTIPLTVAKTVRGWALSMQGREEEGIAQLQKGVADFKAAGTKNLLPYLLALLAEAYGKVRRAEAGLKVLAEALTQEEKTGEHYYEAELYRLKGELALQEANQKSKGKGQKAKIETSLQHLTPSAQAAVQEAEGYFQKAIDIARRQQAKSLELRAIMSLVRLRQHQAVQHEPRTTQHASRSRFAEAHRMLSEIYGWFTEGFDTKDLQEAKALLEELA